MDKDNNKNSEDLSQLKEILLKHGFDELPELTPKQSSFVDGVVKGMSATDAYKNAYNTEKTSQRVIWKEASKLKSDGKVAVWLDAVKYLGMKSHLMSQEEGINECRELITAAKSAGQYGAWANALKTALQLSGLMIEKHETTHKRDTSDIERTLREISEQYGNETMRQIAVSDGYGDIADKITSEALH